MKPIIQTLKELESELESLKMDTARSISRIEERLEKSPAKSPDSMNDLKFRAEVGNKIKDIKAESEITKKHTKEILEKFSSVEKHLDDLDVRVGSGKSDDFEKFKVGVRNDIDDVKNNLEKKVGEVIAAKESIKKIEEKLKGKGESTPAIKIKGIEKSVAGIEKKLAQLEKMKGSVFDHIAKMESKVGSRHPSESMNDLKFRADVGKKLARLSEDMKRITGKDHVEKTKEELKRLLIEIERMKNDNEEWLKTNKADVFLEKMKNDMDERMFRVKEMEKEISDRLDRIKSTENSVMDLKKEIEDLKLKEGVDAIKTKKTKEDLMKMIERVINKIKETEAKNEKRISDLERKGTDLSGKLQEIMDVKGSMDDLKVGLGKIDDFEGIVEGIKLRINEIDTKKDVIKEIVNSFGNFKNEVEMQISDMKNELNKMMLKEDIDLGKLKGFSNIKQAVFDLNSKVASLTGELNQEKMMKDGTWKDVKTIAASMKMLEDRISKLEIESPNISRRTLNDLQLKIGEMENSLSGIIGEFEEMKWSKDYDRGKIEVVEQLKNMVSDMDMKVKETKDDIFRLRSQMENDIEDKVNIIRNEKKSTMSEIANAIDNINSYEKRFRDMENRQKQFGDTINSKLLKVSNDIVTQMKEDQEKFMAVINEKSRDIKDFKERVKEFVNDLVTDYQKRFEVLNEDLERVTREIKTEKSQIDSMMGERIMESGKNIRERIDSMKGILEEEGGEKRDVHSRDSEDFLDMATDIEKIKQKLDDIKGKNHKLGPIKRKVSEIEEKMSAYQDAAPFVLE
ncbi:MAG: hypothetical protein JW754_00705 [Candidatus Aenigmarchaeota archaeon]|nr:hypothetical protein [Candidatus Aenigmarchaeota archaeon]